MEFFGNIGIEDFLGVFVAVGILWEQELMYWRTELGSGIWRVRVVGNVGIGGLFRVLEVSCALVWAVSDSSQESLVVGEFVSKNGEFCWVYCDWVVKVYCGWGVITDVWVWSIGVLLGVTVVLSGEYGADGLWFEDEESSMSVSEFKYAVYSGNVWNEWVELDNGEGLFLSFLAYFLFCDFNFQILFQLQFRLLSLFILSSCKLLSMNT